ncbi:lipase family protein [Aquabacterium sp. CECT 9606]|uniref:lipase family protein n=1 Tax=Aquabacterium sp. CECT 9606 TaxID=2845822 RepID=UPI001E3F509A|nr:lipase family protein [Aquabacterium sp. CECT 9606]CAH0351136.1 putative inactive lipase [Aquabacterium sp. CECT 9606]
MTRALLALLATLALASTAAQAQEAYPAPASPPPLPQEDAFYQSPTEQALGSVAPGTVLRYREVSAKAYYLFPVKGKAWQLMYRSTNHKGLPVAMVGTVLVPENAPAQQRKLLSYNVAYDALTLRCAPSYEFVKGTALEQALIQSALKEGMVVMSADYEGLQSLWTVGVNSGNGVLDGIRAAERFTPAGLDGVNTPVAITGYSGGSVAAAWANELYPSYAPELNIKGVAAGGIPVDLGNVARKIDGKLFAGVYFGAVTALTRAYPEIDVATLTNDKGKAMLVKASEMCLGQFLTGAPDPLVAFAFQKMSSLVTVPDLLQVPGVKAVIAENRLGQRTPGAPMYIYQGTLDEMMPIADVDGLVKKYCAAGVKLTYKKSFNDHILLAITGYGNAFSFLKDRLNGKPAASNCN